MIFIKFWRSKHWWDCSCFLSVFFNYIKTLLIESWECTSNSKNFLIKFRKEGIGKMPTLKINSTHLLNLLFSQVVFFHFLEVSEISRISVDGCKWYWIMLLISNFSILKDVFMIIDCYNSINHWFEVNLK